jgi:hypothetical protein
LNIIQQLWSVLESKVRNRPTSISKATWRCSSEEGYKIPLETIQNLYESIRRRIVAILKPKLGQHHINRGMCTVSVVFPLFCPTPLCMCAHTRERDVPLLNDDFRNVFYS